MKSTAAHKPLIAVTTGDVNGIGPEVGLRAVVHPSVRRHCTPVLVGSLSVYAAYARMLRLSVRLAPIRHPWQVGSVPGVPVLEIQSGRSPDPLPGRLSRQSGAYAAASLREAAIRCTRHEFAGMVTAPVSKEALSLAGYRYPGQTEFLAHLTHSPHVVMMFVGRTLRVALATVHMPISAVPRAIREPLLSERVSTILRSLRRDFGIAAPRIALLGLNPHAGEHGLLGTEETRILLPFLRKFHPRSAVIEGPFPPDAFWGTRRYRDFDLVFSIYHDQGLIPFKLLEFSTGVNFSAGLSIIRTSPDHGTAFDIAGRGKADPGSTIAALQLAADIARTRMKKTP